MIISLTLLLGSVALIGFTSYGLGHSTGQLQVFRRINAALSSGVTMRQEINTDNPARFMIDHILEAITEPITKGRFGLSYKRQFKCKHLHPEGIMVPKEDVEEGTDAPQVHRMVAKLRDRIGRGIRSLIGK